MEEEGFFDVLKRVTKIGGPITSHVLNTGIPFLGPIGEPITAIAGTALGTAGRMAEALEQGGYDHIDTTGIPERAILAEAALQTVLKMGPQTMEEIGVLNAMGHRIGKQHQP